MDRTTPRRTPTRPWHAATVVLLLTAAATVGSQPTAAKNIGVPPTTTSTTAAVATELTPATASSPTGTSTAHLAASRPRNHTPDRSHQPPAATPTPDPTVPQPKPAPAAAPDAAGEPAGTSGTSTDTTPTEPDGRQTPTHTTIQVGQPELAHQAPPHLEGHGWVAARRPIAYQTPEGWQVHTNAAALLQPAGRTIHPTPTFAQQYGPLLHTAAERLTTNTFQLTIGEPRPAPEDHQWSTISLLQPCNGIAGHTARHHTTDHLTQHPDRGLIGVNWAATTRIQICPHLTHQQAQLAITHELAHAAGLDHHPDRCNLMAERLSPNCQTPDDPALQDALAVLYPPN